MQFHDDCELGVKLESVISDILMCDWDDEKAKMFTEQGLLLQYRVSETPVLETSSAGKI